MLASYEKENLEKLSKEQLVYVIEQYDHLQTMVGNILVRESKSEMEPKEAVSKIRKYYCDIINKIDLGDKHLCRYIDMKHGKISVDKYTNIAFGDE